MDDNNTYDEMCSEEAEFIHYEGGESLADDNNYADDYVHHSVMGQQNFNGDNTDFVHHAALYGAYLASKKSSRKKSCNKGGGSSSAHESISNANANEGQSGCLIFAVVIIVLGAIMSFVV